MRRKDTVVSGCAETKLDGGVRFIGNVPDGAPEGPKAGARMMPGWDKPDDDANHPALEPA